MYVSELCDLPTHGGLTPVEAAEEAEFTGGAQVAFIASPSQLKTSASLDLFVELDDKTGCYPVPISIAHAALELIVTKNTKRVIKLRTGEYTCIYLERKHSTSRNLLPT